MSTLNYNIWTNLPYVYKATTSGVDIFNYETETLIDRIPVSSGATSVWANNNYVYFGTTYSGVFRATVSGLSTTAYKQYPDLLSNSVLYLHGNDDYISIATVSGVDSYKISTDDRISTVISGTIYKCWQTSGQEHYFSVNSSPVVFGGLTVPVYNWSYVKRIEFDGPIPENDYPYDVTLTMDNVYSNSYGYDLRILQSNGNLAPYVFKVWESGEDPIIGMKLDKDVTDVYIIYGFEDASVYTGTGSDIYTFYDDFSYTTSEFPENTWEFTAADGSESGGATYILDGNTVKIRSANNRQAKISTVEEIPYHHKINMNWRRYIWSVDSGDMDSSFSVGGGYSITLGGYDTGSEVKHAINVGGSAVATGSEYIKDTFITSTVWMLDGYQKSEYNGEVLTANAALAAGTGPLSILLGNNYNQPDIEVDRISVGKYSLLEPNYTEHATVPTSETNFYSKLYAVYSNSSNYIYTSGLNNIIKASHINDIYITEGTSQYGPGNVIFLGTDLGAVIIEERRGNEANCNFKYYRLDT